MSREVKLKNPWRKQASRRQKNSEFISINFQTIIKKILDSKFMEKKTKWRFFEEIGENWKLLWCLNYRRLIFFFFSSFEARVTLSIMTILLWRSQLRELAIIPEVSNRFFMARTTYMSDDLQNQQTSKNDLIYPFFPNTSRHLLCMGFARPATYLFYSKMWPSHTYSWLREARETAFL